MAGRKRQGLTFALTVILIGSAGGHGACASDEPADSIRYLTGKPLETALEKPVRVSCDGIRLDHEIQLLSRDWRIAILRDRRTDPSFPMQIETGFVPKLQVLNSLAEKIPETRLSRAGSLFLIAPKSAASRFPVLIRRRTEQVNGLRRDLPAATLKQLTSARRVSWPLLSEPRTILADTAAAAGMTIRNPEAIPHDVWAAGDLPPLDLAEAATVILNQFDLTFTLTAEPLEMTIVAVNPDEQFEHAHPVSRTDQPAARQLLLEQFPDLKVRWSGSAVTFTASLQQHSEVSDLLMRAVLTQRQGSPGVAAAAGSLRTRIFQLAPARKTVGQLILELRMLGIPIEVSDEDSPEVRKVLALPFELRETTDKLPGSRFFPTLFSDVFETIDVRDDKIILSVD